jgi:hypothetical protein
MNSRIDIHADFRSLKVRTQPTSRWTLGLMARLLTAVTALHRRRFKTIVR